MSHGAPLFLNDKTTAPTRGEFMKHFELSLEKLVKNLCALPEFIGTYPLHCRIPS